MIEKEKKENLLKKKIKEKFCITLQNRKMLDEKELDTINKMEKKKLEKEETYNKKKKEEKDNLLKREEEKNKNIKKARNILRKQRQQEYENQ